MWLCSPSGCRVRYLPGKAQEEAKSKMTKLPTSLPEALSCLEADAALVEGLGEEMVSAYVALRREQCADFSQTVSQWELDNTLDAWTWWHRQNLHVIEYESDAHPIVHFGWNSCAMCTSCGDALINDVTFIWFCMGLPGVNQTKPRTLTTMIFSIDNNIWFDYQA